MGRSSYPLEQDRVVQLISGFPRPDGLGRPRNHEGDAQNWIPSLLQLWKQADTRFPGWMDHLYDDFTNSIDQGNFDDDANGNDNIDGNNDTTRRSLLNMFYATVGHLKSIMVALNERSKRFYTERISSVFLHHFTPSERFTHSQSGAYDNKYLHIGKIEFNENKGERAPPLKSTKYSLVNKQGLQLALLFNKLVGSQFSQSLNEPRMSAKTLSVEGASDEVWVENLYYDTKLEFNGLFDFLDNLNTGLTVTAGGGTSSGGHALPTGGKTYLSVKVLGTNSEHGVLSSVSEYPLIVEFKRANAGFWIGWTLLTGQKWADEQKDAFFELRSLPRGHFTRRKLEEWQSAPMWGYVRDVLNRVGSKRVDVTYNFDDAGNFNPCYSIRGENDSDITSLLDHAKLKVCLDNCLKALGQSTHYARGNNCDKVAVADGLTFFAVSIKKFARSTGVSNPHRSEHVLRVDFDSTYMMQTHQKNSSLDVLQYLCNNAMTSRLRCFGYWLLLLADEFHPDPQNINITPETQEALETTVMNHVPLVFDSQVHCRPIPAIVESNAYQSIRQRAAIERTLGEVKLAELLEHFTSRDFNICEWFREDIYQGASSSGPSPGRSKSVARVQRRSESDGKNYVLKEYCGDADSMAKAKLELDAYELIAKLDANDKKHVAELVAFGSLNLDGMNPRLCLLLEYVEEAEDAPEDNAALWRELSYVASVLDSVGVSHNDLEDRNYRWQQDADGSWYIKVFDFDHAKLYEPTT